MTLQQQFSVLNIESVVVIRCATAATTADVTLSLGKIYTLFSIFDNIIWYVIYLLTVFSFILFNFNLFLA